MNQSYYPIVHSIDTVDKIYCKIVNFIKYHVKKDEMMVRTTMYISFAIILTTLGCTKERDDTKSYLSKLNNSMHLDSLEVGDKYYFSYFIGENAYDISNYNFEYTGDTLELEILETEGNEVIISERLLPGSNVFKTNSDYYWNGEDTVYINKWFINKYRLEIEKRGRFVSSHLMSLDKMEFPSKEVQEAEIIGWKLVASQMRSKEYFIVPTYELNGSKYKNLFAYADYSGLELDGNAYTVVYSKNHGIVKTMLFSFWIRDGRGWDRIQL